MINIDKNIEDSYRTAVKSSGHFWKLHVPVRVAMQTKDGTNIIKTGTFAKDSIVEVSFKAPSSLYVEDVCSPGDRWLVLEPEIFFAHASSCRSLQQMVNIEMGRAERGADREEARVVVGRLLCLALAVGGFVGWFCMHSMSGITWAFFSILSAMVGICSACIGLLLRFALNPDWYRATAVDAVREKLQNAARNL